jgi:lipopolysaccharide export system permease protein
MFGILARSIFWELFKVFALSLIGITGIVVLAGVVAEASQQGLGPAQILAVIPLVVPSMLPYTIPTTTLFASCVVYGRLSHDAEIIAIKAAGINIMKVVWPALFLGVATSVVTMSLYYSFIPYTHHLMRSMFINDVEEFLYTLLRRDREIRQPNLNYAMWVHRVQGRRLQDAIFKRCDAHGNYDVIAWAREAELRYNVNTAEILVQMRNGIIYSEGGNNCCLHFEEKTWSVPLPPPDKSRKPRPREMTWPEVNERRAEVLGEIEEVKTEIALWTARQMVTATPNSLPQHLENLKMVVRQRQLEMNSLDTELQMRPALAFGCLFFVLVGCPVGIWLSRSDYLSAFITCFLPIVCLYYPILLCGTNLAKDGKIVPGLSVWAADGVLGVIALLLYRRLLRN